MSCAFLVWYSYGLTVSHKFVCWKLNSQVSEIIFLQGRFFANNWWYLEHCVSEFNDATFDFIVKMKNTLPFCQCDTFTLCFLV